MGALLVVALLICAASFVLVKMLAARAEVRQLERDVYSQRPIEGGEEPASLEKLQESLLRYPQPVVEKKRTKQGR